MRRKIGIAILITLVSILLAACSNYYPTEMRVNFKQDTQINSGIASAVYGDRVYYVSNELGKSGIYSMGTDGSDVRMETQNPSVIYLQVMDGDLVYSGIYEADENNSSSLPTTGYCHKVYESTKNQSYNTIINDILEDVYYNYNIVGNYQTGKGTQVYVENGGLDKIYYDELYLLKLNERKILEQSFFEFDYVTAQMEFDGLGDSKVSSEQETANFKIDQYEDSIVLYSGDREEDENCYIYPMGSVFSDGDSGNLGINEKYSILSINGTTMYLSFHTNNHIDRGMLIELNLATKEIRTNTPQGLGENECAVYAAKHNGEILVVTENADSYEELQLYPRNQKLQVLDTQTLELREIFESGEKGQILAIQDEYIVVLEENVIYKYKMADGVVGARNKIAEVSNLPKSGVQPEQYQVDVAGDWLFFYKIYGGYVSSYSTDMGQQLLYKINLETGEVLENARELDFSELDPYRVRK